MKLNPQENQSLLHFESVTYIFQRDKLTHPEVVHDGDSSLEALGDLHVDVLVEAGPHRTERRQRGPIILTSWRREQKQVKPKKAQTLLYIYLLNPIKWKSLRGHY